MSCTIFRIEFSISNWRSISCSKRTTYVERMNEEGKWKEVKCYRGKMQILLEVICVRRYSVHDNGRIQSSLSSMLFFSSTIIQRTDRNSNCIYRFSLQFVPFVRSFSINRDKGNARGFLRFLNLIPSYHSAVLVTYIYLFAHFPFFQ